MGRLSGLAGAPSHPLDDLGDGALKPPRSVTLAPGELRLDGRPVVLVCASVFPFRIAREDWERRLRTVVELGYTAVDVYIPWNAHELSPGKWHLDGERDVDAFFSMCKAAGLLVLARPGPYICSEWDGGGLPAWLAGMDGVRLRQNDPVYLGQVRRWFDQILPIIARHQYTRGGPVALLQLENELDFFDCEDPAGYVGALADLARESGITVPLIACAGQGAVERSGASDRVAAAVNLYPDDDDLDVEDLATYYEHAVRELGLPLVVTETNRAHRTLKRLLVCGVRFLGPYLQTSGWNFEDATAVNNWGDPLGFMAHDYDFDGVVGPDGAVRADGAEARVLTGIVGALGDSLATGRFTGRANGVEHDLLVVPTAMRLGGGGELLSLVGVRGTRRAARIASQDSAVLVEVPADTTLLLLRDLPLTPVSAVLRLASAELIALADREDGVTLDFVTRGPATIVVDGVAEVLERHDLSCDGPYAGSVVTVSGREGAVSLACPSGTLHIRLTEIETSAEVPTTCETSSPDGVEVCAVSSSSGWSVRQESGPVQPLERLGVHRGAGRYVSLTRLPDTTEGVVLRGAADVVALTVGSHHTAWFANGGSDVLVPTPSAGGTRLEVTTHTWGHSNFDDGRLPSLRLGSSRGISGALAVTSRTAFSGAWTVVGSSTGDVGSAPPPRGHLGGWMTAVFPQTVTYGRTIGRHESGAAALHATGSQARLDVLLDDEPIGTLTPLTPVLWLGDLRSGQELKVRVLRSWGEAVGTLDLLRGDLVEDVRIDSRDAETLVAARDSARFTWRRLPVTVSRERPLWVRLAPADLAGAGYLSVRLGGEGLLVTALSGGQMLGRVLCGELAGATLRGGKGDYLLLPPIWRHRPLDLLMEATGEDAGRLDTVLFEGSGDGEPTRGHRTTSEGGVA